MEEKYHNLEKVHSHCHETEEKLPPPHQSRRTVDIAKKKDNPGNLKCNELEKKQLKHSN